MNEPSHDFRLVIKESVQELFNMKKSGQEALNQTIETGLSFQRAGIQLGIPYQKMIQLGLFLKQNWSGISATQKQNPFQNADIQLGILNKYKTCFPLNLFYRNIARNASQKKMRGGNSCDTRAIQLGINFKINDYIQEFLLQHRDLLGILLTQESKKGVPFRNKDSSYQ